MPRSPVRIFPSHSYLLEVCNYDPETGVFTRKKAFHKSRAGKVMGGISVRGYLKIKIDGIMYSAGPLAWFYMTGKWPKLEIDHIDRNKTNNVFSNLREATTNQNQANAGRYGRASPYRGVMRVGKNKWRVVLKYDNKSRHVGVYDTRDKAALAYDQAARKQFGEFAILNLPASVHRDWILV
jgi:hypothetical protein